MSNLLTTVLLIAKNATQVNIYLSFITSVKRIHKSFTDV